MDLFFLIFLILDFLDIFFKYSESCFGLLSLTRKPFKGTLFVTVPGILFVVTICLDPKCYISEESSFYINIPQSNIY